ncbi:MAG: protein disulfide oxidoreductase [Myxococcota bacterium]
MIERFRTLWARRWVRWISQALAVLAIYGVFHSFQTRELASGAAPELAGQTVRGATVSLGAPDGAPKVVHFWATWCGVCKAEEGTIDSFASDRPMITVATRSGSNGAIRAYLDERGLRFDALADPRGSVARAWGVRAFPSTFVVGADGKIASRTVGYTTTVGLHLRYLFAPVL